METKGKYNFRGKNILIVEDDEVSSIYLNEVLLDTGACLNSFRSGKEAVEFFKNHEGVGLVLMDLKLPDISGLQATKEIKKIRKEIPIIVQTACTMKQDKKLSYDAGCDFYLTKPLNKNLLLDSIAKRLA